MRMAPIVLVVAAVLFGVALLASTENIGTVQAANELRAADTRAREVAVARVQAKVYRIWADLLEARYAEKPDWIRVGELTKDLQLLRSQLRSERQALRGVSNEWSGDLNLLRDVSTGYTVDFSPLGRHRNPTPQRDSAKKPTTDGRLPKVIEANASGTRASK
jgi:hypothetical protein